MKLKPDFVFRPLPLITRSLHFFALRSQFSPPQLREELPPSPLGLLQDLPGTWTGTGFNVIWRPTRDRHQPFLELNLTSETLEFEEIKGEIPNRGLLQDDIFMYGLTYLQQIKDFNTEAGLHIETGMWATVPKTDNPKEDSTVVRMASIPHGTSILAQGTARMRAGLQPIIRDENIIPFTIGDPHDQHPRPESDLSQPTPFRSPPSDIDGITQEMVDNPNLFLLPDMMQFKIANFVELKVSSKPHDPDDPDSPDSPDVGGGVANTAFLQGSTEGPNAQAAQVDSTFWIETVPGHAGRPGFHQLQYTQRVLLNFAGRSWPHISVATLRK